MWHGYAKTRLPVGWSLERFGQSRVTKWLEDFRSARRTMFPGGCHVDLYFWPGAHNFAWSEGALSESYLPIASPLTWNINARTGLSLKFFNPWFLRNAISADIVCRQLPLMRSILKVNLSGAVVFATSPTLYLPRSCRFETTSRIRKISQVAMGVAWYSMMKIVYLSSLDAYKYIRMYIYILRFSSPYSFIRDG